MRVIYNIIKESINEKSRKIFTEDDIIIFFNKDEIINKLTNHKFWISDASCYRKMKDVERKLKKKNIEFYYYTQKQLDNFANKFKFNDNNNIPKFNQLYFKLIDYNTNIVSYYTYNDYIRKNEDYKYDFLIFLFSYFGLKRISWSYDIQNNNRQTNNVNANIGTNAINIQAGINTTEERNNDTNILGFKEFSNIGALDFFNTCKRRVFWYTYCTIDIEEVVKNILKNSNKYFYEYYKNNRDLQVTLENRLNGAMDIEYTYRQNNSYKIAVNKMAKVSNNYGKFGFSMNSEVVENNIHNKKYNINFYRTTELEISTLENIIWNEALQTSNINMNIINQRYKKLINNSSDDLQTRYKELQKIFDKQKQTLERL